MVPAAVLPLAAALSSRPDVLVELLPGSLEIGVPGAAACGLFFIDPRAPGFVPPVVGASEQGLPELGEPVNESVHGATL
jgi:hypothetical protein